MIETVEHVMENVTIRGTYSVGLTREKIRRFLIDFALEFDIDIIDDPVVVRTSEKNEEGEYEFGYRALVPISGSALFAYFNNCTQTYFIHLLAVNGFDASDADFFCSSFFNTADSVKGE